MTKTNEQVRAETIEEVEKALRKNPLIAMFLDQRFWHAHHVDIIIRHDGQDRRYEADWIKDLWKLVIRALAQSNAKGEFMHHDKCPNGQACMQNTTGCLVGKCAREIKTPSVDVAVSIAAPESQSTPLTDAKIIRTVNVFWTDASGAKKSAYELVEANFARRLERAYRQAIGALEKLLANHYYRDEAHAALAQSRKLRERR